MALIVDLYRLSLAADSVMSILEGTSDGYMFQTRDQIENKKSTLWVVSLDVGIWT
jgi:hypothetical protein